MMLRIDPETVKALLDYPSPWIRRSCQPWLLVETELTDQFGSIGTTWTTGPVMLNELHLRDGFRSRAIKSVRVSGPFEICSSKLFSIISSGRTVRFPASCCRSACSIIASWASQGYCAVWFIRP